MVNVPSPHARQPPSSDDGSSRRPSSSSSSRLTPVRSNSFSTRTVRKGAGLNKRLPNPRLGSNPAARSTLLTRPVGKLPWLDGNANSRILPGVFDETELKELGQDGNTATTILVKDRDRKPQNAVKPEPVVDEGNLPLRPYASTHSLGRALTRLEGQKLSPASIRESSVVRTKLSVDSLSSSAVSGKILRGSGSQHTPSTYSGPTASDQSSDRLDLLERTGQASYERLVDKPFNLIGQLSIPERSSSLALEQHGTQQDSDPFAKNPSERPVLPHDGYVSSNPPTRNASIQVPRRVASDTAGLRDEAERLEAIKRRRSMQGAVSGLQGLMEEALQVAADAARQDRSEEVAAVLNEATRALRSANNVSGHMSGPLRISDLEEGASSSDYTADSSDISTDFSDIDIEKKRSVDTVPTMATNSRISMYKPKVNSPYLQNNGERPKSEQAVFDSRRPGDFFPDNVLTISQLSPAGTTEAEKAQASKVRLGRATSTSSGVPPAPMSQSLYHPPSADSIIIDFAYVERTSGEDVTTVPRQSVRLGLPTSLRKDHPPGISTTRPIEVKAADTARTSGRPQIAPRSTGSPSTADSPVRAIEPTSVLADPSNSTPEYVEVLPDGARRRRGHHQQYTTQQPPYYEAPTGDGERRDDNEIGAQPSFTQVTDPGHRRHHHRHHHKGRDRRESHDDKYRHQPIAREWSTFRKRITAAIACFNTVLLGLIAGIYAGEVPKIQYQLADQHHRVILGNVLLYIGLGITTLLSWPLPLLHGRKPYILLALGITLPLQFPQALAVNSYRSPKNIYYVGLLLPRFFTGLALGFANTNFIATLFDLFGASLQSRHPHQEIVKHEDPRRQGGGMGLWLGIWAWCFVGSLAVGFLLGAGVTANLNPAWGFYFIMILLAVFLMVNVVVPETRRSQHRRSVLHYFDDKERLKKKTARGEVKLHLYADGPKHWWEEVWAGVKLMGHMMLQPGFFILAIYLAWIYALVVLVTLLLGALLSTRYSWPPQFVGLAVFALAVGALFAIPLTKANLFSRDRIEPARTDSMTFKPRVTWSSHLVRRCIFTFALPIAGLAFTLTSPGPPNISWIAPVIMSALVGFLSTLAIAECIGLTMETFDTCDLQPGVNSKHRLQSLESVTRRRRTNYSSFPRVAAGLFAAQGIGFFLAAAATGVSGRITRALGAQAATGVVAGILLFTTMLLSVVLWRFKTVQVIPDHALGTKRGSKEWTAANEDDYWKPVIVGNPSGKVRRMNLLESGKWSRWTEIRKLNKLAKE